MMILGQALNSHWKRSQPIPDLIPYLSKGIPQLFVTGKARTGGMTHLLGLAQWEAW